VREERKRTARTPPQTFLGALAPRPSPVTTAPPGMIERKVLACGGGTTCTLEGREEVEIGAGVRSRRRGMHPSFIQNGPRAQGSSSEEREVIKKNTISLSTRTPAPRTGAPYFTRSVSTRFSAQVSRCFPTRPSVLLSLSLSLPVWFREQREGWQAAVALPIRTTCSENNR